MIHPSWPVVNVNVISIHIGTDPGVFIVKQILMEIARNLLLPVVAGHVIPVRLRHARH